MVSQSKSEDEGIEIGIEDKVKQPCGKSFTSKGSSLWVTEGFDDLLALLHSALSDAAKLAKLVCSMSDCKTVEFVKLKNVELVRQIIDGENRKQMRVEVKWKCVKTA